MKPYEAKDQFNKQLLKLRGADVDDLWLSQTAALVRDFLGEDSEEYKWIKSYQVRNNADSVEKYLELTKFFRFVDGCDGAIKQRGFYKKPKENFLRKWSSQEIGGILLACATTIGGLGYWGGTITSKFKIEKLQHQVEAHIERQEELNNQILILQDSLSKY